MFASASLLNHRCHPNAVVMYEGGRIQTIRAVRPIARDEQVTISYIEPGQPSWRRDAELYSGYMFHVPTSRAAITASQVSWQSAARAEAVSSRLRADSDDDHELEVPPDDEELDDLAVGGVECLLLSRDSEKPLTRLLIAECESLLPGPLKSQLGTIRTRVESLQAREGQLDPIDEAAAEAILDEARAIIRVSNTILAPAHVDVRRCLGVITRALVALGRLPEAAESADDELRRMRLALRGSDRLAPAAITLVIQALRIHATLGNVSRVAELLAEFRAPIQAVLPRAIPV